MKCDACGAPVENGKCTYCGKMFPLQENVETQTNINHESINTVNYNQVPQGNINAERKRKDKAVALLLCIFLGYFGAHKFYEGKAGMGILYLFTMGLFGIGWIVDIISIAMKPNPYYV